MKVVVKRVGKIGEIQEIEGSLKVLQYLVGGYITTYPLGQNMLIICNEEGLLQGLKPNLQVGNQVLVGDIVIVKQGKEDFESLDEAQIKTLKDMRLIK
jgi:hypothetical protein